MGTQDWSYECSQVIMSAHEFLLCHGTKLMSAYNCFRLPMSTEHKPHRKDIIAKLQLNWAELALIPLSPTVQPSNIHPTIQHPSIHPIKFILQLICISVMCSCTLVSYGSNCKAQTRFSSSWAELALVSINLTTHPPTTPPCGTVYFSGVSCLIESIEACVA